MLTPRTREMSAAQNPSVPTAPAPLSGKPVFLTLASVAKTVPCSRYRVSSAVVAGDLAPLAYLDLDGRLQPLFSPNAAIVLLALIRGRGMPLAEPMPPIFTSTQSHSFPSL